MCLHPRDASQTVHSPTRAQSVTKRKLDVSATDPHDAAVPGPPSSRPSNPMNASPFPTSAPFKSQSHYDQRPYTGLGSSAMYPVMFYPFAYSLCLIHLLPFLRLIVSLCFLHTCHVPRPRRKCLLVSLVSDRRARALLTCQGASRPSEWRLGPQHSPQSQQGIHHQQVQCVNVNCKAPLV